MEDNSSLLSHEEEQLPDADAFDQYMKCRLYRVTLEHELVRDAARKQLQKPPLLSQKQLVHYDKPSLHKKTTAT